MFDKAHFEAVNPDGDIPVSEPERQYYYMKLCRLWMDRERARLGRNLTVSVQTLGCRSVNVRMIA